MANTPIIVDDSVARCGARVHGSKTAGIESLERGREPDTGNDGLDLECSVTDPFDLVLRDIEMPDPSERLCASSDVQDTNVTATTGPAQ